MLFPVIVGVGLVLLWLATVCTLQKWHTSSYARPATGTNADDALIDFIDGIDTIRTLYSGTSDPDDGSWGSAEVGTLWLDTTNEIDAAGDDLGPILKRWSMLTTAPTYGWRTLNLVAHVEVSPNTNKLNLTSQSTTAFTACDVTADTSALAIAVWIGVTVKDSTTPASSVYASFRKQGVTTDAQTQRVYPQVAGIPAYAVLRIPLDNAQTFEYDINASGAGTFDLRVDVLGYEARG